MPRTKQSVSTSSKPRADILDRSRPFSTVHAVGPSVAAFKQPPAPGGRYYDAHGKRVHVQGEEDERPVPHLNPKGAPRVPAPTIDDGEATPIDPDDVLTEDAETAIDEPAGDTIVGDVNLTAWALGQEKYRFAEVKNAIRDRYARDVTNESDALDFLIAEGAVPTEAAPAAG